MKKHLWALAVFLALLLATHTLVRASLRLLSTNPEPIAVHPKKAK